MRAYSEISDFEDQLARHGVVIVKFWLPNLQGGAAQALPGPRAHPLQTLQDHSRGLAQRDAYQVAAADMIERASTTYARWTRIEANDNHTRARQGAGRAGSPGSRRASDLGAYAGTNP
jgi:AMP-polyphosphate phosphotransferase